MFCKVKDYSPQRRKERKGKLKIWEKRRKTNYTTHEVHGFPRTKGAEDKKDAKKNKTDNFNHGNTRICPEVKDQEPAEQHVG